MLQLFRMSSLRDEINSNLKSSLPSSLKITSNRNHNLEKTDKHGTNYNNIPLSVKQNQTESSKIRSYKDFVTKSKLNIFILTT